jgi:AAA15 family ATPase/GTPase
MKKSNILVPFLCLMSGGEVRIDEISDLLFPYLIISPLMYTRGRLY